MTVRAITFDFWCTLFEDANGVERHRMRVAALTEATRAAEADADRVLRDIMAYFLQHHIETQYTLTPRDAARMACEALNVSAPPDIEDTLTHVFGTAILAHPPVPVADALDAVRAAAAHVPVALISDTGFSPGANLRVLLEKEGFTPYLGAMTFSNETGVAKPQRPMFERTAEALGVASHELLHIGDLEPTDIVGAHQAGGKAGLFTAVNASYADVTRADYIFGDWRSFIDMLPQLL